MRKLFLLILTVLISLSASAGTIMINSECIKLTDIFPEIGIDEDIACGLDYGQEKTINRQMASYIINKYGIKGAQPGEATFKRNGTLISEERLKDDIKNQLSVMYPDLDVEVTAVRMAKEFYAAPGGQYTIDLPAGRFGNISMTLDNGYKKTSYSVSLTAFKNIYVTKTQVRKGDSVKDSVALMRTDLSKVHGDPIDTPDGFIARVNIAAGRPVTSNIVDKQPDALKDTNVTIIYRSGALEIAATGILREDAYEGKIVRVENASSGKILRGVYQDGRKVLVNER